MTDPQPPTLPQYPAPGLRVADRKEAAPMLKLMGKMMAKRMPRIGKNPNIHSQTVKLGHKKKKDQTTYY